MGRDRFFYDHCFSCHENFWIKLVKTRISVVFEKRTSGKFLNVVNKTEILVLTSLIQKYNSHKKIDPYI